MKLSAEELNLVEQHRKKNAKSTWVPKSVDDYTAEEKCEAFNRLYDMALDHFNDTKERRFENEDSGHYMFEAVMELLGKDVWKVFNSFTS